MGLLVDNSGSMQPNRDQLIAAAQAFAESTRPDDELFAIAFNEIPRAALPPSAPFTSDISTLRAALTTVVNTRGRTALFDAIDDGLAYLNRGRWERKVLVLLSDGVDNASRRTLRDVLARVASSNALIYTVALMSPYDRDSNPRLLKQLAEATGGETFAPKSVHELVPVLRQIARAIRHTYAIGYMPTDLVRDGTFRQIRLMVDAPDRRRVIVRTREGYLALP
jgi:Ca-activated chloride channel homolog